MEIIFRHDSYTMPKVSIILVDWSCRESFHILDYLNDQMIPRQQYELIWIEYYSRRSPQIATKLKEYEKLGKPPAVDKWIVLGMPNNIYYHKHLMYNLGIAVSKGEIICFCDSDAIVKPTFIESIIKAFEKDPNIVLHLDEVRNVSKKFYPFNFPSIEEVIGEGCINFRNGTTTGLLDEEDYLHTRNYGACMSALRKDLIAIGGADEHIDYLGHICGPYEMTFRLVNTGKREIWHKEEFLYHTRHPGTDGRSNYLGPHDGKNMSSTALDILRSGRTIPLAENPAVRELRLNGSVLSSDVLLSSVISEVDVKKWKINTIKWRNLITFNFSFKRFWVKLILCVNIFSMSIKQLFFKTANYKENKAMPKSLFFKFQLVFIFFWRMCKNNIYAIRACRQVIEKLKSKGITEVAFLGAGGTAKILYILAKESRIKVTCIYDRSLTGKRFLGLDIYAPEDFNSYLGKIIIASFVGIREKTKRLEDLGISRNNIVSLQ